MASGDTIQEWQYGAKCQVEKKDTDFFFPSERETKKVKAAKAYCSGCLSRFECMLYGIEHDAEGIYGGATQIERRLMRALLAIQESQVDDSDDIDTNESVPVTHIVTRTGISRVAPLPFVLDLHALQGGGVPQELHSHVPVETQSVQAVDGSGVLPFILRIA